MDGTKRVFRVKSQNEQAQASAALFGAMIMSMVNKVRGKFGMGMTADRAIALSSHISPSDYARAHGSSAKGRRKHPNRLHMAKAAKIQRRKAAS